MLPVLFSIGSVSISSFGMFLALGFLVGVFLIWRLSRAWDLDEEKILDLTLLTFLGGLVGARLYFGLTNPQFFSENYFNIVLINKIPGFSFWGAILGGWLTLYFVSRAKRINFWQAADIASVGLLGGLILSSLGCFLGSCSVGIQSNLFFAVYMAGFLGKRFPTQALEALLLFLLFLRIWSLATHFHSRGKIISLTLIYIGIVKFVMEFLKENRGEGVFLSLVLISLGMTIFYRVNKKSPVSDLKSLLSRRYAIARVQKYWYNQKTLISWRLKDFKKYVKFPRKNH